MRAPFSVFIIIIIITIIIIISHGAHLVLLNGDRATTSQTGRRGPATQHIASGQQTRSKLRAPPVQEREREERADRRVSNSKQTDPSHKRAQVSLLFSSLSLFYLCARLCPQSRSIKVSSGRSFGAHFSLGGACSARCDPRATEPRMRERRQLGPLACCSGSTRLLGARPKVGGPERRPMRSLGRRLQLEPEIISIIANSYGNLAREREAVKSSSDRRPRVIATGHLRAPYKMSSQQTRV